MGLKVGLALSGGGARGFAHVGVIKSLERHKIPIHAISGISAGALFGGLYASGVKIEEIEELCYSTGYKDILKLIFYYSKDGSGGLISWEKIDEFIKSHVKKKKIENFPIKFGCGAADLITGKLFYFKDGPASIAIRASCAIPGIFKPVKYKKMYLVDGGILEPIAINLVKNLGGEINIGIDLFNYPDVELMVDKDGKIGIKDALYVSFRLMENKLTNEIFEKNKDVLRIRPDVGNVGSLDFGSKNTVKNTIKEGEEVMDKNISKVKEMIKNYQKK